MTIADVDIARYFAELANLPDVSALREADQRRLANCMLNIPGARAAVLFLQQREGGQDLDLALRYLGALHGHVRTILQGLLAGRSVLLQPVKHTQVWRLIDGALHEELPPSDHALDYFFHHCRQKKFPFGCCPMCKTIFARVRRQLYCSADCRNKAVAARGDGRREYMRKYMAKRRAKKRKAKQKKGQ